jgi:hypothetical protein
VGGENTVSELLIDVIDITLLSLCPFYFDTV